MTRTDRPTGTRPAPRGTALISGAGIAGCALAHWLDRAGYAVTVVEKSATLRSGGYPVDVRGTALDVVERMGLLPRLRDAHVGLRRLTFLNGDGSELTSLPPHAVTGGDAGRDLEIPRGELTEALYATVRDRVEFVFDDRVDTLVETGHGVDVTFRSGTARTFDLVLGADGTHSRTREMLFGPEERFHHHLGHCFAVFTLPNTLALSHETVVWNTPGRAVALYAVGDSDEVHAFLDFARPEPPRHVFGDSAAGQALLAEVFADAGWRVPEILTALHDADDVFLDAVGQIRMPRWTSGRAALLGDAAYAPSFLTGQGTSLALVGAYMLAASLAGHRDHTAGLAAYEHGTRPFVTLNQNLVGEGGATLFPATAEALARRNTRLRSLRTLPSPPPRPAHSSLTLPAFPAP